MRNYLFVAVLCFAAGLAVGVKFEHSYVKDDFSKQRFYYDALLERSNVEKDSIIKIIDSLQHNGTVIVEKIKKIYVYKPYDTLGSSELRKLMLKEYDQRTDR